MSDNTKRLKGMWQGYALIDANQVRELFERQHGYVPAEVVVAGPILLAGPLVQAGRAPATPARPRQLSLAWR